MALSPGDKLGPYECIALIGKGGMGEVWKAHDPRLKRDVAIKVSAAQFSERFEREAQAIAALNHPNICQLYDVGPNYLVMEYIEGTPLKGPLPVDQALKYAAQICDALDAAHRKGITHRDLKPANILVTKAGIKLLDFGLAKLASANSGQAPKPDDATLTMALTGKNEIVGTLYYMSPEQLQAQATGQEIDARSDIFSFGLVLYEMLTGKRAFEGSSPASVIAAIMERPAPSIADTAPAALDRVLKRCLEKDPDNRWQTARDLKAELEWIASAPDAETTTPAKSRLSPLPWVVASLFLLATVGLSYVHFRETSPAALLARLQIPVPESLTFNPATAPAVSPDGRWVAFAAVGPSKVNRVWIRALDSLEVRELPGTEVGTYSTPPFWSFDSRFIAFGADGKLKKIDISGGPPQTIGDAPGPTVTGGAWNKDGVIIAASYSGALSRASASGGPSVPMTVLAPGETAHRWPQFLPDGRHFLYHRASGTPEKTGIFVGSIDLKPEQQSLKPLMITDREGAYVPSEAGGTGWLLFVREGTLVAQAFDPAKLELGGDPVPMAGAVGSFPAANFAMFSVSATGVLVYRGGESGQQQLTWFDLQGRSMGALGEPGQYPSLAASPDGKRVAVAQIGSQGNVDIWVLDATRGTSTRLTFDPAQDAGPVWSPDGNRIAFTSTRGGGFDLYQKASDGSGDDQLLLKSDENKFLNDWSRDGRFLLYNALAPRTGTDLWVLPLEGDRKPIPFLRTEFSETQGKFSPDGHWIAYVSTESGSPEVYVRPFSPNSSGEASSSGGKWMVSKGGGLNPHWRGDGKQLFYGTPGGQVMAVDVTADKTFQSGVPKRLFGVPVTAALGFDVTADGKRFLFATQQSTSTPPPFTVVLNWRANLKR